MSKIFSIGFLTVFILAFTTQVDAQDDRRKNNRKQRSSDKEMEKKIRQDVTNRMQTEQDEYEVKSYSVEDDYIRVVGERDGREWRTYYTPEGEFEESVYVTSYSALPEGVQEAFMRSNMGDDDVQKVFYVQMKNETFYAVKVRMSGDIRYAFVNLEGDQIEKEKKLLFMNEFYEQ